MRIENAFARKQARIDADSGVIVGVNRCQTDAPTSIDHPRSGQYRGDETAKSKVSTRSRPYRDQARANVAVGALTRCAETGEGNLLAFGGGCSSLLQKQRRG